MATLKNTVISDTGFLKLPSGVTSQRPTNPSSGMIRYNTDFEKMEYYNGSIWIEATSGQPADIVTSGLVVHLDAGNQSSYPGSGEDWYDLSGGDNNSTLVNGPNYSTNNGGYLIFDGSEDYSELNLLSIDTDFLTIEMWCKRDDSSGAEYHWDARNGGGTWFLSEYVGYDWNWGNVVRFNDSDSYTNWHQIVAVKDNSVSKLYKNGNLKATGGNVNGTLGNDFYIAARYTKSGHWNGNVSSFKIYNRALSDLEIQLNFEALRDRYGI